MVRVPGDHYTFWRVPPAGAQRNVRLLDQFRTKPFETFLYQVEYLGNPAWKTRHDVEEPVERPDIHLLGYVIDPARRVPAPKEPVIVRNQFTGEAGQKWLLGDSSLLMIPAFKWTRDDPVPELPPPPVVDHFLCYDVREAPLVEEPLRLRDQFAQFETKRLKPVLFGVPADKNGEGRVRPDLHLAIYELYPYLDPPAKPGFGAIDQVRTYEGMNAQQCIWLGVPSFKEWNPD